MPRYSPGTAWRNNESVNDPRVGAELRRFRESKKLLGDHVAKALRWSPSKVSRFERSRTAIGRQGLEQILQYYTRVHGMPRAQARAIQAMFEQAMEMARFLHPLLGPAVMAAAVREWSTRYVPRLLQTQDYAMSVLRDLQSSTGMSPGDVRDTAAAITLWQARLAGKPPVRLYALLDEAVLYRQAGSPAVMRAQLEHLAAVPGTAGTSIEIRVLPFTATGVPRWTGAFSYLEYAPAASEDEIPEVVTEELDGPGQPELCERDLWHRLCLFTELWKAADEPGPAIQRALKQAWS
jgi:Domain of unknown function (DUF5753)/Helix-turn-helix domain